MLALPEGETRIGAAFVEQHVGISKDFNNFELVSALVAKDVLKVNRIVKYFNDNPKNFFFAAYAFRHVRFFQQPDGCLLCAATYGRGDSRLGRAASLAGGAEYTSRHAKVFGGESDADNWETT